MQDLYHQPYHCVDRRRPSKKGGASLLCRIPGISCHGFDRETAHRGPRDSALRILLLPLRTSARVCFEEHHGIVPCLNIAAAADMHVRAFSRYRPYNRDIRFQCCFALLMWLMGPSVSSSHFHSSPSTYICMYEYIYIYIYIYREREREKGGLVLVPLSRYIYIHMFTCFRVDS